jgi:hypothetical protein
MTDKTPQTLSTTNSRLAAALAAVLGIDRLHTEPEIGGSRLVFSFDGIDAALLDSILDEPVPVRRFVAATETVLTLIADHQRRRR